MHEDKYEEKIATGIVEDIKIVLLVSAKLRNKNWVSLVEVNLRKYVFVRVHQLTEVASLIMIEVCVCVCYTE